MLSIGHWHKLASLGEAFILIFMPDWHNLQSYGSREKLKATRLSATATATAAAAAAGYTRLDVVVFYRLD